MKEIFKTLFILLSMISYINASAINNDILSKIEVYNDTKQISPKELNNTLFKPLSDKINVGLDNKSLWLKYEVFNKSSKNINKLAVFNTSNLENIKIYQETPNGLKEIQAQTTLSTYPFFELNLKKFGAKRFYIYLESTQIPSSFDIQIKDKKSFLSKLRTIEFTNSILFGFLFTVVAFFTIIYFYRKEKSYIYFAMFVLIALFYLYSYSGLSNIYTSSSFYKLDKSLTTIKLNLFIIFSSLYSILFLKLKANSFLYRVYLFILFVAIIEIFIATFQGISYYFVLFISALYAIINVITAIAAYFNGVKEARFYTIGMIILAIGIYANIFNALNMDSFIKYNINYIAIFSLAILFLVIAYMDRFYSTKQKELDEIVNMVDKKLIIDRKVAEKTKELSNMESSLELLKTNMNAIIRDNLQNILNLLKLQNPKVKDNKTLHELENFENKIDTITKIYSNILTFKDNEKVDMNKFLSTIIDDLKEKYKDSKKLNIKTNIDAKLNHNDAIYIGLHVTDYLINRYKNSKYKENNIYISLKNENDSYSFNIKDDENSSSTFSGIKKLFT